MTSEKINKTSARIVEKYKTKILPILNNNEAKRQKMLKNIRLLSCVPVFIALVAFLIGRFYEDFYIAGIMYVLITVGIVLFEVLKINDFKKELKRGIMFDFCECFENLHWDDSYWDIEMNSLLEAAQLFYTDSTSRYIYDDVFDGSYKKVPFSIYEMVSYTFDRVGTRIPYEIKQLQFRGVVIKVKMNKKFKGRTVICPNDTLRFTLDSKLKRTKLEDVEFEKKFDVYTTDEVEARYLITASFMQRIKNIQTAFLVNNISCSFYDNHILIALYTDQNLFEPISISKPLGDYIDFLKMTKEIISIYKLIDYFKLSEKTGL